MAKQLNEIGVNLSFTADTQQAKAQLQDLQNSLTKLTKTVGSTSPLGLTDDISSAISKVTELQAALQRSTTKAGKLDLGQFHQELNKANLDATKIADSLSKLGAKGQIAFVKLAQSVTMAEVPIKRTNRLLTEFATTLKNTARWQISSSILHGFMGSLQSAYGYAQDLNESLTNIRIVTGQSSDQMAEFAKQANESAKALSTTTTAYTDAALIFYQQGLTGDDVTERTDAVIKMSNVTGDAVEDVSSYMTAIWNNFDDGSQSLEHYADVITALGAATASSSAEIANGLERFAAIGETVGLSYDYATAALATVVATTRQSEEIVGTAFKTIFARMQGLQLGETLDDGTDLNKYSKVLEAVGVSVKDQNGELRDMDNILDDLGAKWQTLSRDQQTALAQTVSGTRQYTQLMALMENWDFFEENVEVARNSEGALQEQADIYAESWEAASKRVKASMQGLYDQLLNDDFFIDLNNGFASVIESLTNFIDSLGGLEGIIPGLSALLLGLFGKDLTKAIDNAIYNINTFGKKGQEALNQTRQSFNQQNLNLIAGGDPQSAAMVDSYNKQFNLQSQLLNKTNELAKKHKEITDSEQLELSISFDILDNYNKQYIKEAEKLTILQQQNDEIFKKINLESGNIILQKSGVSLKDVGVEVEKDEFDAYENRIRELQELQPLYQTVSELEQAFLNGSNANGSENAVQSLNKIKKVLDDLGIAFEDGESEWAAALKILEENPKEAEQAFKLLEKEIDKLGDRSKKVFESLKDTLKQLHDQNEITDDDYKKQLSSIEKLFEVQGKIGQGYFNTSKAALNAGQAAEVISNKISNLKGNVESFGSATVKTFNSISSIAMAINSLSSIPDIINNDDLSVLEKATQITISLSMGMGMLFSSLKNFPEIFQILSNEVLKYNTALIANEILEKKGIELTAEQVGAVIAARTELGAEATTQEIVNALKEKNIIVTEADVAAIESEAAAHGMNTIAELSEVRATELLNIAKQKLIITIKNLITGIKAFFASLGPVGWAIIAITTAITGLITITKLHNKALKENAEISLETAKNHKEVTDQYKEEAENLAKLSEEYAKLKEQYDEGKISSEDLKHQVIDLANEYNNQEIAVKALAGAYTNLNDAIKEQQKEQNNKILKSSKKDYENYSLALETNLLSTEFDNRSIPGQIDEILSGSQDRNNIKIKSSIAHQFQDTNITEFLRKRNVLEDETLNSEEIVVEDFIKDYVKNQEDYDFIIKENKNSAAAKQLRQILTDNAEFINEYKEARDQYRDAIFESTFENQFDKDNFNIDQYYDIVNLIKENSGIQELGIDDKEIDEWVNKQILAYDEVSNYAKAIQAANTILADEETTDAQLKQLANKLKDFSDSQLSWIILHPHIAEDETASSIKKLVEENQAQIDYEESKTQTEQAASLMKKFNAQDGSFKTEDREQMSALGVDGAFSKSDAELLSELQDYYQERLRITNEYYDAARISAEEYQKSIEEEGKENLDNSEKIFGETKTAGEVGDNDFSEAIQEKIDKLGNAKKDLEDSFGKAFSNEDILDFIDEYNEATEDGTDASEELEDKLKDLEKAFDKDYVNSLRSARNEQKKYNDKLQESKDYTNSIQKVTKDYQAMLEGAEGAIKGINGDIDGLQNAYKTMTSAQQEYNEKGYYTVDTIQSLLDLGPEYLQYMSVEGNQILINKQGIEDQQQAYYNLLEAKYTDYYATQMQILQGQIGNDQKREEIALLYTDKIAQDNLNGSLVQFVAECQRAAAASTQYRAELMNLAATAQKTYDILTLGRGSAKKNIAGSMGAAPKAKGGGGGGGGSKKDPETKEHKEYVEDLADRYHDLNQNIDLTAHSMELLSEWQDHLAGGSLIYALRTQNKLLEKQKKNYEAINAELKKEQQEVRDQLATHGNGIVFSTDEYGTLLNYTDLFNAIKGEYDAAVDAYNKTIDEYNAMSADAQEKAKDTIIKDAEKALDDAKESYDKAQDYLKRYDEISNELMDNEEKLQEQLYEQIENNLEAFEVNVSLSLDIEESKRKVNTFIKDINTNFKKVYKTTNDWMRSLSTGLKNIKSFTDTGGTIDTRLREIKEVQNIIDNANYNYNSADSMFVDRSEAITKLKEYTDELMDEGEELFELFQDAWEEYLDAFDQIKDQWDDIIDDFDKINDTLDHHEKIIEMLYDGSEAVAGRQYLSQLYQMSINASLSKQSSLRKDIEELTQRYDELIKAGAEKGDKDLEEIANMIEEANGELQSEIENYLETIQNQLTNSIKSILDTADKAMTKGYGINKVIERWNDAKDAAEGYYDEVERVYQLERMESLWEDTLRDTTSVKNQQYIKTIMDSQLKNLREKTKLSEYDITLSEKELAIIQAQMALEDARNNKNSMKLTRNEQGNWSYQYVADEDDVAEKEQDLLNKLYDKYEYVKQSSEEAIEALLDLYQTAQERLSELMEEYKFADETRRAEIEEEYNYLYNYYYGPEGLIVQKAAETHTIEDDLNKAGMELLWDLYEVDQENYLLMTEYEKDLITQLKNHGVDSFRELMETVATDDGSFYNQIKDTCRSVIEDGMMEWQIMASDVINNWYSAPDSVRAIMQKTYTDIRTELAKYDAAIQASEQASGIAWSNVENQIRKVQEQIYATELQNADFIEETKRLPEARAMVKEMEDAWNATKSQIEQAVSALQNYLNLLREVPAAEEAAARAANARADAQIAAYQRAQAATNGSSGGGSGGGGSSGGSIGAVTNSNNDAKSLSELGFTVTSQQLGGVTTWKVLDPYGKTYVSGYSTPITAKKGAMEKAQGSPYNWNGEFDKTLAPSQFATGGYTGDWSDGSGKIGILHSKELVLNKEDTANILAATAIMRSISGNIGGMIASLSALKPGTVSNVNTQTSSNDTFNITAEFPNANNMEEIQQAILTLPNVASQYINSNLR